LGRLSWRLATVVEVRPETGRVVTLDLEVPGWDGHLPGQHLDVRLTAEDGYQAERSYSIASAPGDGRGGPGDRQGGPPVNRGGPGDRQGGPPIGRVELAVERLDDGEVSPYLAGELRQGDQLELRGPIGGYFVWEPDRGGPLLLVAGGSGVAPLMAMLRHRAATGSQVPARLLYSSRTLEDVIFREELERLAEAGDGLTVTHTLTRAQPPGWAGYARRIDAAMLEEVGWPPGERPLAYVCGPTRLVEGVAGQLVALGHDPARVKTERFGPTGVP
jgi:ferredoxin-NADP reductase